MSCRISKKLTVVAMIAIAIALSLETYRIYKSALRTLSEERARMARAATVQFKVTRLSPHPSKHIRVLQSVADTRGFVRFGKSFFAATGGGLVEYSKKGVIRRRFTVLDGLPESDLTTLRVFRGKLYIGTRRSGLLEYDGTRFRRYEWTGRQAQSVTALLDDGGKRLLIGTFNGGLLEFSGREFRELKAGGKSLHRVTNLERFGNTLYVGTFDNGLWTYLNDRWENLGADDGLPSDRITGVAESRGRILVATDLGICEIKQGNCVSAGVLPIVSGITAYKGSVYVSRDNGEIFLLGKSLTKIESAGHSITGARLLSVDGKPYLTGSGGIFEFTGSRLIRFGERVTRTLTDNFVSALTVDSRGRLWSGTFRSGIDVLSPEGRLIRHLETENVREINFLEPDPESSSVNIATTRGVYRADAGYAVSEYRKGLRFPSVASSHIAKGLVSSARGLAFADREGIRFLTASGRLPNNSVYSALRVGKTIYAGTLGGLARIDDRRVSRIWKDTNSKLSTNWVTALVSAGPRIFIGTYGGGLFELLPSGEIHPFAGETGRYVVNLNALATDGRRLYVGTLDGLRVLDLQSRKWRTMKKPLPSLTVMSITASDGRIYIGTSSGIAVIDEAEFYEKDGNEPDESNI